MAPARPLKRQKTNPTQVPQSSEPQPAQVPLPPDTPTAELPSTPATPASSKKETRSSFFSRTWPRKTAPLTDIARESVPSVSHAAQETAVVVKDKVKAQRSPSIAMTLGKTQSNQSNRSLPANATTTIVNATPDSLKQLDQVRSQSEATGKAKDEESVDKALLNGKNKLEKTENTQPGTKSEAGCTAQPAPNEASQQPQLQDGQASWLSWLSRREATVGKSAELELSSEPPTRVSQEVPLSMSAKDPEMLPAPLSTGVENSDSLFETPKQTSKQEASNNKRNWYQMWSSHTSTEAVKADHLPKEPVKPEAPGEVEVSKNPPQNLNIPSTPKSKTTSQASSLETSPPPALPGDSSKSSGWVFWSRDRNRPTTAKSEHEPHVGEIAISDTPSQARPKRASISLPDEERKPVLKPPPEETQSKKVKDQKVIDGKNTPVKKAPEQKDGEIKASPTQKSAKKTKPDGTTIKAESSNAAARAREPLEVGTPRTASPVPSKKETPNSLLPQFKDTLSLQEHPSILQQLARLLYYTKEPEFKHLHIVKDPPRITNALAIGVHGYFPAPLIRSVLGQPTGTSIKFADMAASAIKRWTRDRGYSCEVKSAALEGEGRIAERVELLWKLLLNWIDEIRKSDFVMIACHSQGVPVAIMLVAKLIAFGCISGARVGICAMAGVNMGPFQEYKSRWISGSAGELFEFSDPNSKVSTDYLAAIEEVLKHGVRLTFTGSIDDQLVSMESSIFAPITHPHIYRAVFVDGRIHAPNFLSHLVGFALKLRNVGVPDHGLIRELSPPLAGSLYTGEGHSRIYEDDAVYDLAITFALETNTLRDIPVSKRPTTNSAGNPYILPFAMRGILEEDYVKTELQNEARELLAQFDEWKPTTKALKDVKFRLEGIRSKL